MLLNTKCLLRKILHFSLNEYWHYYGPEGVRKVLLSWDGIVL